MKKLLFGLLSLGFIQPIWADSVTGGSVGLLQPSTNQVDTSRSYGAKLNENFKIIAASMTGIITGTIPLPGSASGATQVYYDEGSPQGGNVTSVNCTGAGVGCTQSGTTVTLNVTATGGGSNASIQNPSTGPISLNGQFGISASTGIEVGQNLQITIWMSTTVAAILAGSPDNLGSHIATMTVFMPFSLVVSSGLSLSTFNALGGFISSTGSVTASTATFFITDIGTGSAKRLDILGGILSITGYSGNAGASSNIVAQFDRNSGGNSVLRIVAKGGTGTNFPYTIRTQGSSRRALHLFAETAVAGNTPTGTGQVQISSQGYVIIGGNTEEQLAGFYVFVPTSVIQSGVLIVGQSSGPSHMGMWVSSQAQKGDSVFAASTVPYSGAGDAINIFDVKTGSTIARTPVIFSSDAVLPNLLSQGSLGTDTNGKIIVSPPATEWIQWPASSLIAISTDFAPIVSTTSLQAPANGALTGLNPQLVRTFSEATTDFVRGTYYVPPEIDVSSSVRFMFIVQAATVPSAGTNVQMLFRSTGTINGQVYNMTTSTGADVCPMSATDGQQTTCYTEQTITNLGWTPGMMINFEVGRGHDTSKLLTTDMPRRLLLKHFAFAIPIRR